ncbi:MAG: aspartate aminotransferase family protein [Polyangia bacterium]
MSTDNARQVAAKHTYGTWRRQRGWNPMHMVSASGSHFTDSDGKKWLDFSSQLMCSNLGHDNKAVIDAIKQQAEELAFAAPGYATTARKSLVEALLPIMPPGLTKFFFTTSGTEANEAAVKIARMYTGKHKIISRYASYHGSTSASISLTGDFRRWLVEGKDTVPGTVFAPDAYCYRCPLKQKPETCGLACADYVEYMIERESNVAAMIIEPIVGTNGVILPPAGYLKRLREVTKKHGVLLICDEVMSGWGRTGEWFVSSAEGITPDILTTAKGISSAYVPLGLTATTQEIADFFEDNYFAHGHTYEAHPITLGPAVAAINEYKRLGLLERAKDVGERFGKKLREMCAKHPSVGDVRGRGLFWAVELVKDQAMRTPFNTQAEKLAGVPLVTDQVVAKMATMGVVCVGWASHLVIAPPLIITEAELDEGLAALDEGLKVADAKIG